MRKILCDNCDKDLGEITTKESEITNVERGKFVFSVSVDFKDCRTKGNPDLCPDCLEILLAQSKAVESCIKFWMATHRETKTLPQREIKMLQELGFIKRKKNEC